MGALSKTLFSDGGSPRRVAPLLSDGSTTSEMFHTLSDTSGFSTEQFQIGAISNSPMGKANSLKSSLDEVVEISSRSEGAHPENVATSVQSRCATHDKNAPALPST